ncbi:MAG: CHAT domain-containing protein, partial [Pirellulaceae bacterium]|nr:CHAT domain-containing protein [Pirellulaceae bacterium]
MLESANDAFANKQPVTGYIRLCIAAQTAISQRNYEEANCIINQAMEAEQHLSPTDLGPAKLRSTIASLRELTGGTSELIIRELIVGAGLWYDRLSAEVLQRDDFEGIATSMHDHFRRLSRFLLLSGRTEESLIAFEAGRALAIAKDVAPQELQRLLSNKPFASDGSHVSTESLQRIRQNLTDEQVLISIAVLPPNLVGFVVSKYGVETVDVPVGRTVAEADEVYREVGMLPHRLANNVGVHAIPSSLKEFARLLVEKTGKREICRFVPYAFYHAVPWRLLLRHHGLDWNQLRFCTEFGVLLPFSNVSTHDVLGKGMVSIGHGDAMGIDLQEEARAFAQQWGAGSNFDSNCSAQTIRHVLSANQNLMISTHGRLAQRKFYLELAEGSVSASELDLPQTIASLVILSACWSGVYAMAIGDNPIGFAPLLLRQGVRRCICTRWPIRAGFAGMFFPELATRLRTALNIEDAFVDTLAWAENNGYDRWRDIACVELIGRP